MCKLIKTLLLVTLLSLLLGSCSRNYVIDSAPTSTWVEPTIQVIDLADGLKPTPYATFTPLAPSPTPVQDIDQLTLIFSAEPFIGGIISQVFVKDSSWIWLVSDHSIGKLNISTNELDVSKISGSAVGVDTSGKAWVIVERGARIAAWDGVNWIPYDDRKGWMPLNYDPNKPTGRANFYETSDGTLWLSTGKDIRRFKQNKWTVFTLRGMGFSDVISKRIDTRLVLDVDPENGNVWVGMCYWMNGVPSGGQGLRRLVDGVWKGAVGIAKTDCVSQINASAQGVVWAGVNGQLWRYDEMSEAYEYLLPPELGGDTELAYAYFVELPVSKSGDVWPLLGLCGTAGCDVLSIRFHLSAHDWTQIDGVVPLNREQMRFDRNARPWIFAKNQILAVRDQKTHESALVRISALYQDSNGEIWLVGRYSGVDAVWRVQE